MALIGTVSSEGLHFRNRIINGDMRIDQRNAGAAVTVSASFPVDRTNVNNGTDGSFSAQQDSSAPAGFINSLKVTTTTADGTLTTDQNFNIQQRIEGTNVADLGFGTASAKTVTLSFWVRSSLTGTFGGSIGNGGANRWYPFAYEISAADTWEYKSVTIPGDTTGTWLTDTGIGLRVLFALGAGPDRTGTAGAWTSSVHLSVTGAVSVIGTLNATFYTTGVQLEVGSVATPFERRPFGTELALCQRYLPAWRDDGSGSAIIGNAYNATTISTIALMTLPVTARAAPTGVVISNAAHFFFGQPISLTPSAIVLTGVQSTSVVSISGTVTGATTGYAGLFRFQNTAGYIYFTGCEL